MATGQVLFQRFYYSKSFVKHDMEVSFVAHDLLLDDGGSLTSYTPLVLNCNQDLPKDI